MGAIRYVECDPDLRERVGEALGEVARRHVCLHPGFTLVAMDGVAPVGLIGVQRRTLPSPVPTSEEGFIHIIQVAPDYRRQGIGRQLLTLAVARCGAAGLLQVRAWSSSDKEAAIGMWHSLGFTMCPGTETHRGQVVTGCSVALRV